MPTCPGTQQNTITEPRITEMPPNRISSNVECECSLDIRVRLFVLFFPEFFLVSAQRSSKDGKSDFSLQKQTSSAPEISWTDFHGVYR